MGGDWYDVFTLPSGQLWIVVGDVAGHGLHAAVVMGRIRSALRAYSLIDAPVAHVLDLVDRKVNHFEIATIATVACAVSNPPYETLTLAVAGHPPPVLASPGRPASFVEVKPVHQSARTVRFGVWRQQSGFRPTASWRSTRTDSSSAAVSASTRAWNDFVPPRPPVRLSVSPPKSCDS